MKSIYSEYKEKICTSCIHYGDNSFQDCEIRKCVDNTIKCIKYEKETTNGKGSN